VNAIETRATLHTLHTRGPYAKGPFWTAQYRIAQRAWITLGAGDRAKLFTSRQAAHVAARYVAAKDGD
jgi:hypothetical protein